MSHHQPFSVSGFHSCDREIGLAVLNGKLELQPSTNAWDWLGEGIYFWEQDPACIKGYFLPRPLDIFNPHLR